MKKFIALILSLLMVISLCACGESSSKSAESSGSAPAQDDLEFHFAVEDFEAKIQHGQLQAKVKIRNLTDKDIDDPFLNFQLLDENGDALASKNTSFNTILAGQAAWELLPVSDADLSEVKGIGFVRISYKDHRDLPIGGNVKYDLADYLDSAQ